MKIKTSEFSIVYVMLAAVGVWLSAVVLMDHMAWVIHPGKSTLWLIGGAGWAIGWIWFQLLIILGPSKDEEVTPIWDKLAKVFVYLISISAASFVLMFLIVIKEFGDK